MLSPFSSTNGYVNFFSLTALTTSPLARTWENYNYHCQLNKIKMKIYCDHCYVEIEIFSAITSLPVFFSQTNSYFFKRQGVFAAGTVFQLVLKTLSNQNCQNLPATIGSLSSDTSLFLMSRLILSGCLNKYITCRF